MDIYSNYSNTAQWQNEGQAPENGQLAYYYGAMELVVIGDGPNAALFAQCVPTECNGPYVYGDKLSMEVKTPLAAEFAVVNNFDLQGLSNGLEVAKYQIARVETMSPGATYLARARIKRTYAEQPGGEP